MLTPKTDYSTNLQKRYTADKATLKVGVHDVSKIAMEISISTTSVEPKID